MIYKDEKRGKKHEQRNYSFEDKLLIFWRQRYCKTIILFRFRAPSFHMPEDISVPLILVGPGSGIAPFRGFWHHRRMQIADNPKNSKKSGPIYLLFGCRYKGMDLYKDEKEQAVADGVLTKSLLALSREEGVSKVINAFYG